MGARAPVSSAEAELPIPASGVGVDLVLHHMALVVIGVDPSLRLFVQLVPKGVAASGSLTESAVGGLVYLSFEQGGGEHIHVERVRLLDTLSTGLDDITLHWGGVVGLGGQADPLGGLVFRLHGAWGTDVVLVHNHKSSLVFLEK